MKIKTVFIIALCLFGITNLAFTQKFLAATIVKKDGKKISGLVHEDLIKFGKKCLFKKTATSKKVNYAPEEIQAVKFKRYYIETQRFKRVLPEKGTIYESLFLLKIVDGEVDLFEKGTAYKENGHYVLINERLIHIQPWYDKMPALRTKTFKRNKKTLEILFEDCNETSKIVKKEKRRFSREVLVNLIFTYNKCKGAEQNILRN